MNCETFTGGYCDKTKMTVPRSWCLDRCKLGKHLNAAKKQKPAAVKKPNIAQMASHFTKAMAIWAAKGLPVCTKEEYTERRLICAECQPGKSCRFCGCNLWLKTAVLTEKCKLNKWNK